MSIDVSTKQKDGIATNGSYDHYPVGFFEISPCFFYGPGVSSEYDNNGRIIKQTFKQAGSNSPTRNYSFEYDSDNKVITSSFWHEKPEESTKAYYEYFDDGRLKESYALRTIYGGAVYVDGSVYEYNGNLVFEYNYNHEEHEEKKSLYFSRFLRYDNNGRLIELSWPISVQAPWDVCDFFYE